MKAVPILVVTNALALALVILLYVQHQDLESQVKSSRSSVSRRGDTPEDTVAMSDRIDRLERLLAGRSETVPAEIPARVAADGSEAKGPAAAAPDQKPGEAAPPSPELPPAEMETFRKNVRTAQRLNAEEDRVQRVVGSLDRLVDNNKIAPMTAKQKDKVARTILSNRQKIPQVWRKVRESGALEGASREDRARVIRVEYENLRTEAQKQIEAVVPAADAKTIVEDSLGDRGIWRMAGDGGGRRGRGPGGGGR